MCHLLFLTNISVLRSFFHRFMAKTKPQCTKFAEGLSFHLLYGACWRRNGQGHLSQMVSHPARNSTHHGHHCSVEALALTAVMEVVLRQGHRSWCWVGSPCYVASCQRQMTSSKKASPYGRGDTPQHIQTPPVVWVYHKDNTGIGAHIWAPHREFGSKTTSRKLDLDQLVLYHLMFLLGV